MLQNRFELVRVDRELHIQHLRGVETLVSQAVIQHFPSREYTRRFFSVINAASGIRWMMLQVRETPLAGSSVVFATSTSRYDLANTLTNFRIAWQSERRPNGYALPRNAQRQPLTRNLFFQLHTHTGKGKLE